MQRILWIIKRACRRFESDILRKGIKNIRKTNVLVAFQTKRTEIVFNVCIRLLPVALQTKRYDFTYQVLSNILYGHTHSHLRKTYRKFQLICRCVNGRPQVNVVISVGNRISHWFSRIWYLILQFFFPYKEILHEIRKEKIYNYIK